MSFDLFVWFEPWPITDEQAGAKLDHALKADDWRAFWPHPNKTAFCNELMRRFPGEPDDSPWAGYPIYDDPVVELHLRFSSPDEVLMTIVNLAKEYGLVLFDPQDDTVHLPPKLAGGLVLDVPGRKVLDHPDADVVEHALRTRLATAGQVVLRRDTGWYLSGLCGDEFAVTVGEFAVEYQDGTPGVVYRFETGHLDEVADLFADFHKVAGEWATPFGW